jgi:diguanylate cyclase (GGDEF)-like protein
VIYTRDTVVNRLVMIARDGHGCWRTAFTGRAWPFNQRWVMSPFPNMHLPPGASPQEVTILLQDGKSIRPWLHSASEDDFEFNSYRLWVLIGGFAGVLTVLFIIGLGLLRSHPSSLTSAYSYYMFALLFMELQVIGIGPAWIPDWPQGEHFAIMQALALAFFVTGIGMTVTTFLRPHGVLRLVIVGGVAFAATAFLASAWFVNAYRVGALVMMLMAPPVVILMIHGLRGHEPWMRWFALGLCATVIGGGTQSATVVFDGAGMHALGSFILPLGNLVESVCWLISLLVRLRTERTKTRERLIYEATHDALTGLPNRAYLTGHFNADGTAADVDTPWRCRGLILIDLYRFKAINDSLGYAAGDDLLVAVSRLLIATAPPGATVAHMGADTFAILLHGNDPTDGAPGIALRIIDRLREPIVLNCGSVHVRASMGVVSVPTPDTGIIDTLRDADSALNLAKAAGGNRYVIFQPVMRAPTVKRFRMEQAMVEALRRNEFQVFYQPIVSLADRRTVGLEALIRWPQPGQGWLAPADFIPVAEETGLIVPIGAWVLERTARQIQQWKGQRCWRPSFYVSVNLSKNQMLDEALLGHIDEVIARCGLAPGELCLELTETSVITNIDTANNLLPALRARHIPLYMDDFGTGYSSLSYLNELHFDVLKIDRSFITGIVTRQQSRVLVRTVLALAQAMELRVIAEGIETEEQVALLNSMGCTYGQGFCFSPPLAAGQVSEWLG